MTELFKKIILLGRPASGKSEIINYIKNTPVEERKKRFHIGEIIEIDDFPMLWTWFEEDEILEKKFNQPRLHSTPDGYFKEEYLWHLLIERISLNYKKNLRDLGNKINDITFLIEFSRGTEHGGYQEAFKHLSAELIKDSVLLYVNVPYEESLRKNRKRFNPDKPDSILEHGLPDSKLEKLYKNVDWDELPKDNTDIPINNIKIPFYDFINMPSKTDDAEILGPELDVIFSKLWERYKK
jgi:hypothetical protein